MTYKKGQEGLSGIVSCMALNPDRSGMMAAGSYSGAALLLDTRSREALSLLEGGHGGGLTHVSPAVAMPPATCDTHWIWRMSMVERGRINCT